jgi:hypothetical protein
MFALDRLHAQVPMDQGKHSLAMLEHLTSGRKFKPDSSRSRYFSSFSSTAQLEDIGESK